jgi:hypothetical protein
MAYRFAISIKNNGVAATIADDGPMPSVQSKTPTFVLFDEIADRFALLRAFHSDLLLEVGG